MAALTKVAHGHEEEASKGHAGSCVAGGHLAGHVVEAVRGHDGQHGGDRQEPDQRDPDLYRPQMLESLPICACITVDNELQRVFRPW